MKFSLALLLPVLADAALVFPRQTSGGTYPFTTKEIKARYQLNAKRTLTRIGPITLKPGLSGRSGMSLDSNGQGIMFSIGKATFCDGGDCTIIAGHAGLEFEDGTTADVSKGVYIHHILATNNAKTSNPFVSKCDTAGDVASVSRPKAGKAGFVGVSDDNGNEPIVYGTKDGSIEGGYWLSKGDGIGVWADLVNLDKVEKKIYLVYDLEYHPGHVGVDAQGSLISVAGCNFRKISTGMGGPATTTSNKFRFFRDGTLVNGKGHLHDGGVAMDFYINDKLACSSEAIYGGEGGTNIDPTTGKKWETISGMTICPNPFKIKDGDYMTIASRYDTKLHPLRENGDHKMAEVMGMWTMNFLPDKNSAPPNPNASYDDEEDTES